MVAGCGNNNPNGTSITPVPIVPNFVLDISPTTLTVNGGVSNAGTGHPDDVAYGAFLVKNVPYLSYDSITVTVSGAPAGVTLSPTTFSLQQNIAQVVTVTTTTAAQAGTTPLAVHAVSSAGTVHDGQVALTVIGPYGITATPDRSTINLGAGATDSVWLSVQGVNGYAGQGPITVTGVPSDVTDTLTTANVIGTGNTIPYIFTAASNASASTNTVSFDGQANSNFPTGGVYPYMHAQVALNVTSGPDFNISLSQNTVVNLSGHSATMSVTTMSLGGFNAPVVYSFSNLPAGLTITPSSFSSLPGSTQPLTFTVNSSTPQIDYTYFIVLDAVSGALHHRLPIQYENE